MLLRRLIPSYVKIFRILGFRPNHSTTTAMLEIQSAIAGQLDKGNMVLVYSTDLSAAFDMLRPGFLPDRLNGKLPLKICRIIHDFLSNRSFCVKVGSSLSPEKTDVSWVCPRVHSWTLTIFFMQWGTRIHYSWWPGGLYWWLLSINLRPLPWYTEIEAAEVMSKHVEWFESMDTIVNVSYTEVVLFSKSNFSPLEIVMNGASVLRKSSMNITGVAFEFDWCLSWKNHRLQVRIL